MLPIFQIHQADGGHKGRLTNINDIPLHAPYLFQEPDFSTEVALKIRASVDQDLYSTSTCL